MTREIWLLIVLAASAFAFLYLGIAIGTRIGRLRTERSFSDLLALGRKDAVKRSRAVLGGQLSEQVAPFLPGFPGDPGDARFLGKPVDFVLFSGLSRGTVDEVLFVEVKSGGSRLSPSELALRKAVSEGRVRFVEYRVPRESAGDENSRPDFADEDNFARARRPASPRA